MATYIQDDQADVQHMQDNSTHCATLCHSARSGSPYDYKVNSNVTLL